MKRILLVATQYRTGERIYCTIPNLAKLYTMDLLRLYEMRPDYDWKGSINMVKKFEERFLHYFENKYTKFSDVDYSKYDLIIFDDNRERNGLDEIYLKQNRCKIAACEHGNKELDKLDSLKNTGVVFDYGFVFGKKTKGTNLIPIGIPSNDLLAFRRGLAKKHILIIVNFLGNRASPFRRFDKTLFKTLPLKELQDHYNAPVLIKLKSRNDEAGFKHNIKYLSEIMPDSIRYEVVVDVEDDARLVAESHCVISAPSTMAFKPIQLGIPTVLLEGYGQTGLFEDFCGLMSIDTKKILTELLHQERQVEFIENTIEGGLEFNSTTIFIEEVNKLCRE